MIRMSCAINITNLIYLVDRKNYDTNCLETGLLQLSSNTHIIVDETKLQPGIMNSKGMKPKMFDRK